MGEPRLRKVNTEAESDQLADDYITLGYEIISQGSRSVILRKKTWGSTSGHLLTILLTAWWTLGIGNLIYALIAHRNAEKIMIRINRPVSGEARERH